MTGLCCFVLLLCLLVASPSEAQKRTIRQIDFRNFVYPWDDRDDSVPSSWRWLEASSLSNIRLINGKHRFVDPSDLERRGWPSPRVTLGWVTYGDLDHDGAEEAAVALNYSTGGTANWDYLYVYKLERGKPKLLASLESGSRADGGLIKGSIENGLLILEYADTDRRVGDCCSEGFIRVRYRWEGRNFVETGARERGDLKLEEVH